MASPHKKKIEHFTHRGHQLTEFNAEIQYRCDGCMTPGAGNRYRCHGCDFDLHEYCGTCPKSLTTFMHRHKLNLLMEKARGNHLGRRICDLCRDNIEGLHYRCNECDFDVHPLCTQLPKTLKHVLHQEHLLRLEAPPISRPCGVCGGRCSLWRYTCGQCLFDVHLECVLVTCNQTKQRSTTQNFGPPPSFQSPLPYFAHGPPLYGGYPPHNMHWVPPQQGGGGVRGEGIGKKMFGIVGQIGIGVVSNFIFGMDLSSFVSL